jgi:hypothetical protein
MTMELGIEMQILVLKEFLFQLPFQHPLSVLAWAVCFALGLLADNVESFRQIP